MTYPPARLGLGGARLGNHGVALDDAQVEAVVEEAWDRGVHLFDTAPHYGLGLSERRLGACLAGLPRDEVSVSTKVGRRLVPRDNPDGLLDDEGFVVPADLGRVWDFSATGVRRSVEESLERLRLDRLDAVYLHDPERWDLDQALGEGLPALARLKAEGLVQTVGVGSMDHGALLAAAHTGAVDELMVAARYTLVDQVAAHDLLPLCVEQGIDVVAAAVFHGGLLVGEPTEDSSYDYATVPPEVLDRARRLHRACLAHDVPLAAAALQFPLRHPAVTRVVVGASTPAEVAENVRLLALPVPEELMTELALGAGAATGVAG